MNVAHVADVVFASAIPPGGAGGASAMMPQLLFFAAIFAIFYFLLIRPQQKQKRARERMLSSIKKGDRVVTTGGLHATVTRLNEQTVVLRVADPVKLEVDRGAIGKIVETPGEKDA